MRSVLSCVFAFTVMGMASAQLDPTKALASMKPGDGLQVELFAAEPMVINPTNMDIDPLGRVWVTEAVNYRCKLRNRPLYRPEGDRVVILVDKDGDGKADEAITFYQGKELQAPLGICIIPFTNKDAKNGIGYRVLVSQSPDILEFWDKDGDGKADGPPTVFLTGFGGIDHDHGVHSIQVGPDGKFYFTVGDQGVKNLQSKNGKGKKWSSNDTDCQKGTVWRCDPDGNNLELIAHNFRNQYEACVDSFGEIWLSDNDDDGNQQTRICHVLPGGNYGYGPRGPGQTHWHEEQPGIVHKTLRTGFGSPTGICFYEGNLLPKQYQGDMIHCDAGPREVRYFKRIPKGAGYELEKSLMLTSSDTWFRPSDVCVAPDGSVMVADWYDPGVGGHGMGDTTRGRIYRLTPTGHKGYKVPEVNEPGLMLDNPCTSNHFRANEMIQKSRNSILIDITEIAKCKSSYGLHRLMRLVASVHFKIEKDQQSKLFILLRLACESSEFNLDIYRYYLLQLHSQYIEDINLSEISKIQSKQQRVAILLACRELNSEKTKAILIELLKKYNSNDRTYLSALNIACGTDPVRRDAILADFEKHFPEWNDNIADLVWELRPKSMMPKMEALLKDAKVTEKQKARIVDILAVSDDVAAGKTMLSLLTGNHTAEVKARAIENLKLFLPTKWSSLQKGKEITEAIDALLKDKSTQLTGLQLIAAIGAVNRVDDVIKIANGADGVPNYLDPIQDEAVRTLGRLRSAASFQYLKSVVTAATVSPTPLNRVVYAIQGLAGMITGQAKDDLSGKALEVLQGLVTGSHSLERKQLTVETLAGTRAGTVWLLDLHSKDKLPKELVADAGRLLRNSPFQGERNKAMILFPAPGKLDITKLPTPVELAKKTGNAENGQRLMASSLKGETQCLKCHAVRGNGGQIGPDLSMIGKKASKENLFESIIQPSKAIADQYVQWRVVTKDEQVIVGLLVGETPSQLTMRDANGKDTVLATANVETKAKVPTSIMPEDLVKTLTVDDLIDMVAYLQTLQTPAYTPATWEVAGPFSDGQTAAGLMANSPALKVKPTLVNISANGVVEIPKGDKTKAVFAQANAIFESTAEQSATLLFGNTGLAKVWVNGELAYEVTTHRGEAKPEQDRIPIKLKKGSNLITVKLADDKGSPTFYATITSEQELKGK